MHAGWRLSRLPASAAHEKHTRGDIMRIVCVEKKMASTKSFKADLCFYDCLSPNSLEGKVGRLDFLAARALAASWDYCLDCISQQFLPAPAMRVLLDVLLTEFSNSASERIAALLNHWPCSIFSLNAEQSYPRCRASFLTRTPDSFAEENLNAIKRCILASLLWFFERLSSNTISPIKIFDLRGYTFGGACLDFVCSSVLLLSSLQQQSGVVKSLSAVLRRLSETQPDIMATLNIDHLRSEGAVSGEYLIYFDCSLDNRTSLEYFCKALKTAAFRSCPVKLAVDKVKLGASFLHSLDLLQELMDVKALRGLAMADTDPFGAEQALHFMATFENVAALSVGGLDFSAMPFRALDETARALGALSRLQSLDVSLCRVRGVLARLLAPLGARLRRLNVSGCALNELDLIRLSAAPCCAGLIELDLSDNDLSASVASVCCLLKATPRLRLLRLARCRVNGDRARRIFAHLAALGDLVTFDLCENVIHPDAVLEASPCLKYLGCLRSVWLTSTFYDTLTLDGDWKERFRNAFRSLLGTRVFIYV